MKAVVIILVGLMSIQAQAAGYLGEWTCIADGIKHDEATVDSRLVLNLHQKEDGITATEIVGHVIVGTYGETDPSNQYYSVFALKNIAQNLKYKPRVYMNHLQFKNVSEIASNANDGGGMGGDLVIENTVALKDTKTVSAHYIFQSGDHLGGTIDYTCKKW